ncbi:hypothetical protein FUAX_00180 [Fulvitalea axinellae]|uniref:FecR family protein n=1 Tax=Fulvitalea axinellae TaxID=1182444 RepID=A0AAU9D449_9BACT|nr:hypothetical protein FUAX_00180 [Fulvitalea axinellae]
MGDDKERLMEVLRESVNRKKELFDDERAWHAITAKTTLKISERKVSARILPAFRFVAAVSFLIVGLGLFLFLDSEEHTSVELSVWGLKHEPGATNIVFDDGEKVFVSELFKKRKPFPFRYDSAKELLAFDSRLSEKWFGLVKISVERGKLQRVLLPDSSLLTVNSESVLAFSFPFVNDRREVFFSGEGLFDVSKDKSIPFVLNSNLNTVRVLGTRFNFRDYPLDSLAVTSLVEGSVKVEKKGLEDNGRVLSPGNQSVYFPTKGGGEFEIQDFEESSVLAWADNKLALNGKPFREVLSDVERFYDLRFHFRNPQHLEAEIIGVFDRAEKVEFLETLRIMKGWKVRYEGKRVLIE